MGGDPASATRLSALDDSFLAVESPTAHMHVGWASIFEPPADRPRPSFEELREHIGGRLSRAPRFRQKISSAPLGLDSPSWVDDAEFDIGDHVRKIDSGDLDEIVADCMSEPLDHAQPLWELCVADELADGRIGVVGKAHHCMVDGIAAVELASVLLDPTPEPPAADRDGWRPREARGRRRALDRGALGSPLRSAAAKSREQLELVRARSALRLAARAGRLRRPPGR